MLFVTLVWGARFVVIRWGLRDAPALWFAALRALVAGVPLLIPVRVRNRLALPGARIWGWVGLLALTNVVLVLGAKFAATDTTGSGVAAVLSNAQPLLIVLPASGLYHERPDAAKAGLLVVGLGGLTWWPGAAAPVRPRPGGGGRQHHRGAADPPSGWCRPRHR